jgi:5-methylcytosine-specific restriction enzyme subunit McrC
VPDRILLWENHSSAIDAQEANLLEDACSRIWSNRRQSPTYDSSSFYDDNKQTATQNLISFSRNRDGSTKITPRHYVGLISVGNLNYVILPKIYKGSQEDAIFRLLRFQLTYAMGLKLPESPSAGTSASPELAVFTEVLFHLFASKVLSVLRRQNYLGYQEVNENIQTIRGRIDFPRHIEENLRRARSDLFHCTFELFQEDNLFARILKYVTALVQSRTRAEVNLSLLREILMLLDDVDDNQYTYRDCLKVHFTRYQQQFIPILQYCSFFLSGRMPDASAGILGVDHVLIDTNSFFEKFVCGFLENVLGKEWIVKPRKQGYIATDIEGDIIKYENDALLVSRCDNREIIVDMKYKFVDLEDRSQKYGISQADLYQMISYSVRRGIKDVLLIYPGSRQLARTHRSIWVHDALDQHKEIHLCACQIPMDSDDTGEIADALRKALKT